jgi:hemolysin activation/secretion protein
MTGCSYITRVNKIKIIPFAVISYGILALPAYAQTVTIPPSAEAARKQEHFREPIAPSQKIATPTTSSLPLQDAPEGAESINFKLQKISIEGSTVYSEAELEHYYSNAIGENIPLSWIFELANSITTKYRNDGYVLSRVIVPQQQIQNGHVRLQVIEGYISNVIVQGADSLKSNEKIERFASNVTLKRPTNIKDVERYLLLIRDIPGHNVESLLRPSEDEYGAADLILDIGFDQFSISAGIDNYGSKYIGPLQSTVRVEGNSLIQSGDRTILRYAGTGTAIPFNQEELRYFSASHSMLLGNQGTIFTLGASQILSYPGNVLEDLDTKSRSRVLSAELYFPIIRSRLTNLNAGVQFDMIGARNKVLGTTMADDRLRVLRASGSIDHVDQWKGVTQINVEGSVGLDIFGASKTSSVELSRFRGESAFNKINVDISRVQQIHNNINLHAGIRTQYTRDRLLSSEEFGVGGSEIGRGYDSSEITGDRGIAARLELQYNDTTSWSAFNSYQAFAFYDVGKVYQSDGKAGNDGSIASVGAGLRFNLFDNASGSIMLAQPLTKQVDSRSSANEHERPLRALFSLAVRY